MEYKTIGGHTFCPELLTDGVIIDVGCRGFAFADYFKHPNKVYCFDPDADVFDINQRPNQFYYQFAISDKTGHDFYYKNISCPEGSLLKQLDQDQTHPFTPCKTITMDELYAITGTNVDVLKLDCEGAEYIILIHRNG